MNWRRPEGGPPRYSTIYFEVLGTLNISINEYAIADVVEKLSGGQSKIPGWCYASRDYLATSVGITRRAVQKILLRLKEKGLVEVSAEQNKLLRTTAKWKFAVEPVRKRRQQRT